MLEIIAVKDLKDATPEEIANLRKNGWLPEVNKEKEKCCNKMASVFGGNFIVSIYFFVSDQVR